MAALKGGKESKRRSVLRSKYSVIKANSRAVKTLTFLRHVEGHAMSSSRQYRGRQKPKPTSAAKGGKERERSILRSDDSVITTAESKRLPCRRPAISLGARGSPSRQPKRRDALQGGR